jgi:sugar phosphate isomerase/epimerase
MPFRGADPFHRLSARMPTIAFTTANYVARQTGWAMYGWADGDAATQDYFAPLETYAERLEEILARIRALGFRALDLWGAHLGTGWATEGHAEIARETLERHGLSLAGYATWVAPDNIERACELARVIGTDVIAAGFSGEPEALAPSLEAHGVRLAVENHPEKTPDEVLAKIERGGKAFGTTVDTGWWGTQGYDAAQAIRDLRDHVVHVHLKDVRAVGEPHDTCVWGKGVVDIEACVRALQEIGYDGYLTIEHEPEDHDPSDEIVELARRLEAWLA